MVLFEGVDILGSADAAKPGTMVDGEKAACSISAK
jgi:hypothetical protein